MVKKPSGTFVLSPVKQGYTLTWPDNCWRLQKINVNLAAMWKFNKWLLLSWKKYSMRIWNYIISSPSQNNDWILRIQWLKSILLICFGNVRKPQAGKKSQRPWLTLLMTTFWGLTWNYGYYALFSNCHT